MAEFQTTIVAGEKISKSLTITIARDKAPDFYSGAHRWGGMDAEDAKLIDDTIKQGREILKQAGVRVGGQDGDIVVLGGFDEVIATELVLANMQRVLCDLAIAKQKTAGAELPLTDAVLAATAK